MHERFNQPVAPGYGPSDDAEADGLNWEQRTFQDKVGDFLNPDIAIGVDEQLAFIAEFWGMVTGRKPPALDEEQRASISRELEAHPDWRVMPSPLLDFADRKDIAEKARAFPGSQFTPDFDALWAPGENTVYGRLLRDPENPTDEGRKSYGLFYKLPSDRKLIIGGRAAFMQALTESGQSALSDDGTFWTYPVMDVRVKSSRTSQKASNMFQGVEPTIIPESLIAMQLLHQANGTPNPNAMDYANEAVYRLKNDGSTKGLNAVAGVAWNSKSKQISMSAYDANLSGGGIASVRMAESGLGGMSTSNGANGRGGLEGFPPGTYL